MKDLAKAILLATKIYKKSYVVDEGYYMKTLGESANEAAESVGFDERGTLPIYLLLEYCWNDILDWANQFNED